MWGTEERLRDGGGDAGEWERYKEARRGGRGFFRAGKRVCRVRPYQALAPGQTGGQLDCVFKGVVKVLFEYIVDALAELMAEAAVDAAVKGVVKVLVKVRSEVWSKVW